ncbi:hemolysin-III related-domain-containing protein [Chaetomium sp. MPI-SDFR-AT-0129]|nr:hemolysin-III related-domain-containing protein [Chaetomium sp. MPI-SDFR-AT-0129]
MPPKTINTGPEPTPTRQSARLRHRQPQTQTQTSPETKEPTTIPQTTKKTLTTAATATKDTANQAATVVAALLHWDDLPPWRRDNPSILQGYRPTSQSWRGSLRSLGYLHNESVNIWTHLLGAVFVSLLVGSLLLVGVVVGERGFGDGFGFRLGSGLGLGDLGVKVEEAVWGLVEVGKGYVSTASGADVVVLGCFFGGAFCCLGMSATYHMLCNHSEAVARVGNKLDYTGIVFLIVGSYVPSLWYGFYCRAALLTGYIGAIVLLGSGCLVVSWFEHFRTPAWRPYRALMFVGLGMSGVVPILHALEFYGFSELDNRMGLSWILLEGCLYTFGAFLYAARFPERKFPGAFDIWGSSHQIFHVCVLLAAACHFGAMAQAFNFHHHALGSQC